MRRAVLCCLCSLLILLPAVPGAALAQRKDVGTFDVYLTGLRAGILAFSGLEDQGRYTAAAEIRTSGLIALLQDAGYDARATGRVTSEGFVPIRYQETANTGDRVSQAEMEYLNGVPQLKVYTPPQKRKSTDVDPATQGGTLDPMTTMYSLLRDVSPQEVCALDVFMFDGRRRSQVEMTAQSRSAEAVVCDGVYRRVSGFTEKEMAKRQVFPFELTYTPLDDGGYRVTRIEFITLLGKAVFIRR